MSNPEDLRYSTDHEWIRIENGVATVGITDYAQDALGDVVYVDLPEVGTTVAAGQAIAEVESTKSVSDIFAPVAGTISEVNSSLEDTPELLNQEPYGNGWIFRVTTTDDGSELLDAAAYTAITAG